MDEIKMLEALIETIPAIDDFSFIKERKINNGLDHRLTALRNAICKQDCQKKTN